MDASVAPLPGFVDFHSHLMPGVDDGAQELAQSLAALRQFAAQGATTCVTTPHFDASIARMPDVFAMRMGAFDAAWAALTALHASTPGLPRILRGVELMLDDPDPDLRDPRLRLAGGPFVLVEFPAMQMPPSADVAITNIRAQGFRPIIAHPERYRNHDAQLTTLLKCRAAGARLQVNAGSFLGQHGDRARAIANALLQVGWIDYLASDHHARGEPSTARAAALLLKRGAEEQVRLLVAENPGRIVRGEDPVAVPPFAPRESEARPWWSRLFGRFGGVG